MDIKQNMTSKERLINTIECKETDYIPCAFLFFYNLLQKSKSHEDYIKKELNLGLDAVVSVGKLDHSIHPDAKCSIWTEEKNGNKYFHRRFDTPKGPLTQNVIQKESWPTEDDFPIFADLVITRSTEVLVKPEEDLEKLKYLLGPFKRENIEKLKDDSAIARKIAHEHNLLQVAGVIGWGNTKVGWNHFQLSVADMIAWLSGYETTMMLSLTKPEVIKEYVNIISDWNVKQIEIYLDVTDVDLVVRRAWYETTDFWTPDAYKNIILPTIKRESELVHQAGKKYGYIITTSFLPIIDYILDSDIDILIGVDPKQDKFMDMSVLKEKFQKRKKAIWGGVNGGVTVEMDTIEETRQAVIDAMKILGKEGGFVLSPITNVREDTENAWNNTYEFINTWKKYRNTFF
ncbi:MAG: hypothetical protein M1308_23885 [Actinobacteria bacterium]|nr:hypothetical protein [Actinomycetota bacterium]